MNDHETSPPDPNNDPSLDDLLSTLKGLEPPLASRIANRQAIAAALSSLSAVDGQRHLSWWRSSVSIPVPLAVSLAVLMALAVPLRFYSWHQRPGVDVASPPQLSSSAEQAPGNAPAMAQPVPDTRAAFKHYETATYVCGIGRVNSETYFFAEE